MLNPENLHGKPLVVYVDGQRREIGVITKAVIKDGGLFVAADLSLDERPS